MAVADCVEELKGVAVALEPQVLGLHFFNRLDQTVETSSALNEIIRLVEQRLSLVRMALEALEALVADGYPATVSIDVSDAILKDLTDDQAAMEAALKHLNVVEMAAALGLKAGSPEPK